MSATNKESAVIWAVGKMHELATRGDARGVDKINAWGYERARGSNVRKERLDQGYKAAQEILARKREE